jgi:hypothetical protein
VGWAAELPPYYTERIVYTVLTGVGWTYDPTSQILTPPPAMRQMPGRVIAGKPAESRAARHILTRPVPGPSTLATFNFVAATAAEIEA